MQHLNDETPIRYEKNPKKPGSSSYERYQNYMTAKTIQEARNLGATTRDLRYDYKHKYLKKTDVFYDLFDLD